MRKVRKAKVEAYAKATTFTPNCKNIVALYQNGNRKSWEVYGEYSKKRKVNCTRGQKVSKTVWFTDWHKVTKAEVAEILEGYGLTIEEFVAIANNDYEVIDEVTVENAVEEIDASEYLVSVEAFESAVEAEIANAKAVEVKEVASEVEELIKEEIESEMEDRLFGQAEMINDGAENLVESAAAVESGDLCIEGKVVSMPDKKGRLRYYRYTWHNGGENHFDTALTQIDKKDAMEIAGEWHLAFSPMSFEEYMTASNAEYRKIRTLYLEKGGRVARDYDAELLEENEAKKAQKASEVKEVEETKETELMDKLIAKVEEQKTKVRKAIVDWEATSADMKLERQAEDERKKLASIKAELEDRQRILKDAIKNAEGKDEVYWKYAAKAKKQVAGWLKMYRDCVKNLAKYRTKLAG